MLHRSSALAAAILWLATVAATPPPDPAVHFELRRSVPEAGATLTEAPSEVRLWFTQVPQDGTMTIRVLDASDALVETGAVAQDPEDGRIFSVAFRAPLSSGAYSVAWRAMGQDGHVVRNRFSFTVAAR